MIYRSYKEIFSSDSFNELSASGANPQRALWASTSTKDPSYSDIKYVAELIAMDTVNTLPQNTLEAFLDHGFVKEALNGGTEKAEKVIEELKGAGVDINRVCSALLVDGVAAFEKSFGSLLSDIEEKTKALCSI
jgi:transaldolase